MNDSKTLIAATLVSVFLSGGITLWLTHNIGWALIFAAVAAIVTIVTRDLFVAWLDGDW